jgi:hypothetical protein
MYISLTIFLFKSGIAFYLFVEIESKEGRKTAYSRHKTASTNDGLPEISKMKLLAPGVGLGDLLTPVSLGHLCL